MYVVHSIIRCFHSIKYKPSFSICLSSFVLWKLISSSSCSSIVGALVRPAEELLAKFAIANKATSALFCFERETYRVLVCERDSSVWSCPYRVWQPSALPPVCSVYETSLAPTNQKRYIRWPTNGATREIKTLDEPNDGRW